MTTTGLFLAFLLFPIEILWSQTVQKNKIEEFYATIRLLNRHRGVVADRFSTYGNRQDFDYKKYFEKITESGVIDELPLAVPTWVRNNRATLDIPEMNLTLVILRDLISFESNYNILTFWQTIGDSLAFVRLDTTVYFSNMGVVTFQDYLCLSGGSCFIVLHASGGDDDIRIGKYTILRMMSQQLPTRLLEKKYEIHSSVDRDYAYDDLRCNLVRRIQDNNRVQARFITTHIEAKRRWDEANRMRVAEFDTVGSDTTYINLQHVIDNKYNENE